MSRYTYTKLLPNDTTRTPCEQLGYHPGMVFELVAGDQGSYEDGSLIMLLEDDRSNCPYFRLISGTAMNIHIYGDTDRYEWLQDIRYRYTLIPQ